MTTYLCFSCGEQMIDTCTTKCEHACSHCGMTNIFDIDILLRLKQEGKLYDYSNNNP